MGVNRPSGRGHLGDRDGGCLPRPSAFNRWGVWATVAVVPLTALGVLPLVIDKLDKPVAAADARADHVVDQLAAVVLAQAQEQRSRLIGVGEPGDTPANVRFFKGAGQFREVGGANSGDLESVLDYYLSLSPRRLVVLGEPGAGKTVLVLELLIRLLETRHQDLSPPVPVVLSASAYDTKQPWPEWLAGQLELRFQISKSAAATPYP